MEPVQPDCSQQQRRPTIPDCLEAFRSETPTTRRALLKGAAAAAGLGLIAGLPGCAPGERRMAARRAVFAPKSDTLRIAFIGTNGIGTYHLEKTKDLGIQCPCFCDVDIRRQAPAAKLYPAAKRYQDYRRMFDEMHKQIDAVMIGIPDHHHYPATMIAMQLGKHVYTQKPLTHTVWEARQLTQAAQRYKVVTQMGNQGHAGEGIRLVYEWVRSGALGDVVETHTWTDRPIWPQGIDRPEGEDPVPEWLNWDVWVGPAPMRPYKAGPRPDGPGPYHWFNWRGWYDFGTGALGDMACHTMDCIFWALEPGPPSVIEPLAYTRLYPESYPKASVIRWHFPRRGRRRAFDAYWYDGNLKPRRPEHLELGRRLPHTGTLIVGTKASLLIGGDYAESPRIIPEKKMREIGKPPKMLERSPGHVKEWVLACKGHKPIDYPKSNFSYAGPMTETILLGNVALRMGRRIEWDADALRVTNIDEANALIRTEYREGWRV